MATSDLNMTIILHSTDTRLATAVYLTLTALLGTLGNILVIVSIVRMKKLGRLYYILIANLSVVALITSVCLIPSHIINILNSGLVHSNIGLCKFLGYLNFTLTLEVLFNTSAIALERYVVVKETRRYLQHRNGNTRKNIMTMVLLWTVPAVISVSGFPFIGYHPYMLDCFFVVSHDSFWYIVWTLSAPAVVAMLTIFVSYFLTLKKVRDSYRKITAPSNMPDEGVNTDGEHPTAGNSHAFDNGPHETTREPGTNTSNHTFKQNPASGQKDDDTNSSDLHQTVPVIRLRPPDEELPWLQEPDAFTCSPQTSTSHHIDYKHPSPHLQVLTKLSIAELLTGKYLDTREEPVTNDPSMSEKAIKVSEKAMSVSRKTLIVSEKTIRKKTRSTSKKAKPAFVDKERLNAGNNTDSVTSISSIVSESNMDDKGTKLREMAMRRYNKQMKKEISLTLHLFPVFVIFCILYLPICLVQTIHVYYPVNANVWLTFSTLELSFSTLSWVLYGVLNKDFRRAYRNILCCQ